MADKYLGGENLKSLGTVEGLIIGTNVQAQSANLSALAGLTSGADKLPYFTGVGTASVTDFSAFGRTLVDDADAGTARTTLGLGTIATQNANNVSITGGSISGVAITITGTPALLATITSIPLQTSGQTTLITAASSFLFITDIIIRIESFSGYLTGPVLNVGVAASFNDWGSGMTLNQANTVNAFYQLATATTLPKRPAYASGSVVKLDVGTPANATTLIATAYVYGFYLA
jgi:hypothetical protein